MGTRPTARSNAGHPVPVPAMAKRVIAPLAGVAVVAGMPV